MGVFDDKKFENLDWMSQITETIDSELNGLLSRLPDRLELNLDTIISLMDGSSTPSLSTGSIVHSLMRDLEDVPSLTWEESRSVRSCFSFEMSDEVVLDFKNKVMVGTIALVKTKPTFSDEELQQYMGIDGVNAINSCNRSDANIGRLNEVMELLGGCESELKGRSVRRKTVTIKNRVKKIMVSNEWRIRDAKLANKVGFWIKDYVLNGNLAAFSNFCKLKVMTHQNMPIYSIEEQE